LVWNAFKWTDARSDGTHIAAAAAFTRRMIRVVIHTENGLSILLSLNIRK